MRPLHLSASCYSLLEALGSRVRRAPIASRSKLNARAVRGSGKLARGVDESDTGSANLCPKSARALIAESQPALRAGVRLSATKGFSVCSKVFERSRAKPASAANVRQEP